MYCTSYIPQIKILNNDDMNKVIHRKPHMNTSMKLFIITIIFVNMQAYKLLHIDNRGISIYTQLNVQCRLAADSQQVLSNRGMGRHRDLIWWWGCPRWQILKICIHDLDKV